MAGRPRPSFPSAPSEPSLRRLGVGASSSGTERPLRPRLVIALVVGLILAAVPLYLWRRPSVKQVEAEPSGAAAEATESATQAALGVVEDAGSDGADIKLGDPVRVKCSPSPTAVGHQGERCDALPLFEKALAKAIQSTVECAPKTGKQGTVNYVLTADFTNKRLHVFPGRSGMWKGPQARRAAACVKRALPKPDWNSIPHKYRYYMIAVMTTYPAPEAIPGPADAPLFE